MRFKGLDLNLLLALDVLIEERSVSRAAERLNLSQPAMSAALGRLRHYFNDPILGLHGKKMIPTAHALQLRPMLRNLLGNVDAMITASTLFDPATSTRRFRIASSDYLATVLLSKVVPILQAVAPGVTIDLIAPTEAMVVQFDQGQLDLVITPQEHIAPGHPADLLFEERQVVVGWSGNPVFARTMTADDFYAAGHVAVAIGTVRPQSFAETQLRAMSRERRIEIQVFSFLLAPEMLLETNRLTIMHERLAKMFAARIAITYVAPPFAFPVMREMIQYHRTRAGDVGLHWLIDQIKAVAVNS